MADNYFALHAVPDREPREAALKELELILKTAALHEYAELWVEHAAFPALCALVHRTRGWLMLIRYSGDAGYSSRSSDYAGDIHATLDFVLGNGQLDHYPASWTLPVSEVFAALQTFAATSRVPETIRWNNDSGDSSSGPNDREQSSAQ